MKLFPFEYFLFIYLQIINLGLTPNQKELKNGGGGGEGTEPNNAEANLSIKCNIAKE